MERAGVIISAPYKNGELEFWRAENIKKKPLARQTDPLLRLLLLPTYENEKKNRQG